MSNLKIQNLKTESLIPYARNAKKHDDAQVALIAGSIREFGFNVPVAVRGEPPTIVAGHGRVLAARKLGLAEVPCVRLDHLSDVQMRAYILADNKLAEKGGGWDEEMLRLEVQELAELDVDLGEIGISEDELAELTNDGTEGLTNADETPEPPAQPVSVLGGSGTTAIACEQLGRCARLMELDPKYVDVIVNRWQEFTGKQATHADTGLTFEATKAKMLGK